MADDQTKHKQSDLLYDYIKFHLGLYIVTPTAFVIIGNGMGVQGSVFFNYSLIFMTLLYFLSGIHASIYISKYILVDWENGDVWKKFGETAKSRNRKFWHHYLYWIGLIIGLSGLFFAFLNK